MRAIVNTFFQIGLAFALLLCITRHPEDAAFKNVTQIDKNDHEFILKQIRDTNEIIGLAEMAEQSGKPEVLVKAAAVKDTHLSVLYLLTDFANQKKVKLPNTGKTNLQEKELYLRTGSFNKEWDKLIAERVNQMTADLEAYSLEADRDSRVVINEVLTTLHFQSEYTNAENRVASN